MANNSGLFDTSDVGGIGGGVSPQQAVAPAPSAAATIAGSGVLQGLGNLAGGIFDGIEKGAAAAKQNQADKALAGYAKRVSSLNAAVEQGAISQANAQRQQRAMYNEILANRPDLAEKLTDFTKGLAGTAGIGDTLAEGTEIDKQRKKDRQAAFTDGYIREGMTPEQQEQAMDVWHQQNAAIRGMELQSKQNALIQQRLSMQQTQENIAYTRTQRANAQVDLQLKKNKAKIQNNVADLVSARTQRLNIIGQDLTSKLNNGEITREQAAALYQQELNNEAANLSKFRGAAGGDYVDSMAKPMGEIGKNYLDFFTGKTTKEVLDNSNKITENKALNDLYQDPDTVKKVAATKICGNPSLGMSLNMSQQCVDLLNKGQDTTSKRGVNPIGTDQTFQQYGDYLKESVNDGKTRLQGKEAKQRMQDVADQYGAVLKGVAQNAQYADKPSDYNAALDMLASPEFRSVLESGATLPAGTAEAATTALTEMQKGQLFPAIQDAWDTANTAIGAGSVTGKADIALGGATGTLVPTNKALRYSWTGNSIEFLPAPEYANDVQAQAKARDLNRKVAPLINKNVRANANLRGSDPTSAFKEMEPLMFGAPEQSPNGR